MSTIQELWQKAAKKDRQQDDGTSQWLETGPQKQYQTMHIHLQMALSLPKVDFPDQTHVLIVWGVDTVMGLCDSMRCFSQPVIAQTKCISSMKYTV